MPGPIRTPENDALFFETFAETANVSTACLVAGYGRTTVYQWRNNDPEFAQRWSDAERIATENLEAEAYRRARVGVQRSEPILHRGQIVATKEITEYSDTLAIFLLKARDPEKYRDRVDINVNWRQQIQVQGVDPDALLKSLVESARKQLQAADDSAVIDTEDRALDWLTTEPSEDDQRSDT